MEENAIKKKIRIGALISGSGTNLQAIINACESGKINGEMVFVGTDNPMASGLERAEKHGIPSFVVDYKEIIKNGNDFEIPSDFDLGEIQEKQRLFDPNDDWRRFGDFMRIRAIAEAELLKEMEQHPFDLLVLAGFMRKLTPYFIDRVNTESMKPRIMNIHPALLPAFSGTDGYGDTFRYGCKVGGCTVHFIDYGEDSGPIIGQRTVPILPGDDIDSFRNRGLQKEYELYPECIQLFAEDRLRVVERTFDLGKGKTFTKKVVDII